MTTDTGDDEIDQARTDHVQKIWLTLTAEQKSMIETMIILGHTGEINRELWNPLLVSHLVTGNFGSDTMAITPELKDHITRMVRADMRTRNRDA